MTINILGYGIMGKQIASLLYLGGFDICLWNYKEVNESEILRQIKILKRQFKTTKEGTLSFIYNLSNLPKAITIESVKEDLILKKEISEYFNDNSDYLYFTNSSSYSPLEIGTNVNGFHFFNPISLQLLELYMSDMHINNDLNEILTYLESLDFEIIKVMGNRGYIGNYILFHEISSALKLIEKYNYTTNSVNNVYKKLYDGRNIFLIIDLIGIDIVLKILTNLKENDETIYLPICLSSAIKLNIFGKKNKTSIMTILNKL